MKRIGVFRRLALPVAGLGLTALVAACGGGSATVGPVGAPGATGAGDAGDADETSEDATADASQAGDAGDATGGSGAAANSVRIPAFPVLAVPDITAMTGSAVKTGAAITASVKAPGVQVTGARCDATGRIVTRSGLTVGGADDGSVVTGQGVQRAGKDGAGEVVAAGVTYRVAKDGSGQIVTDAGTVNVKADGSGQYVGGGITYHVNADGSGQYIGGDQTVTVNADGSGQWIGPQGSVTNAGDGSGQWVGEHMVTNMGDGTGTVDGAQVAMDPLPKVAPMGRFPLLTKLKPVGRPCGTLIRISAELLFDFDSDTLRPEADPVLRAVAKALRGTATPISVNGHTDAEGSDSYNLDLSVRRAQTVLNALRSDGLTAPLTPHGYGETQPVAPNTLNGKDNPAGRQLNRRVEIVVGA